MLKQLPVASRVTASIAGTGDRICLTRRCALTPSTSSHLLQGAEVAPQPRYHHLVQYAGGWDMHDRVLDAEAVYWLHSTTAI